MGQRQCKALPGSFNFNQIKRVPAIKIYSMKKAAKEWSTKGGLLAVADIYDTALDKKCERKSDTKRPMESNL